MHLLVDGDGDVVGHAVAPLEQELLLLLVGDDGHRSSLFDLLLFVFSFNCFCSTQLLATSNYPVLEVYRYRSDQITDLDFHHASLQNIYIDMIVREKITRT